MDWFLDYYVVSILISSLVIFVLRSVLSNMKIDTLAFFCFPFARSVFFHPLTFSPYVSWGLKQVSCWQHIYGSCFCIHSTSLCLLVGAFNRLTFKIVIAVYFCLSEKLLISPPSLNEILAWYSNLGCRFLPFTTFNISCLFLMACRVSAERSAVKHMRFPLYVTFYFFLSAFRRRWWQSTSVLLPGKSYGQRSLVGCSPWRCSAQSAERLHFHFSLSCIGEGNGNPLQCSCWEKPRDRGARWAVVYRIAQSWTWMKWLSSSGSSSCF